MKKLQLPHCVRWYALVCLNYTVESWLIVLQSELMDLLRKCLCICQRRTKKKTKGVYKCLLRWCWFFSAKI